MMLYLAVAVIGLAVFIALLGVRSIFRAQAKERITQRLYGAGEEGDADAARVVYPAKRPLPPYLRVVAAAGWALPFLLGSEDLHWELMQAGYRHRDGRAVYAGSKALSTIVFGLVGTLAGRFANLGIDSLIMVSVGAVILGYFAPNLWVGYQGKRRREQIMLSLPDGLDLMVICVEAGQGLNAALLRVGIEMRRHAPALSDELQMVNYEIRMGLSRGQALRNFASRTGVEEARALAAVLIQSDKLGTSVARPLRVHAQSMRTRRRQRAEEAARKTPVKLVFPLVFLIFPELLLVLLAPAMLQLYRVLSLSAEG
jgi:tight adherence protein C